MPQLGGELGQHGRGRRDVRVAVQRVDGIRGEVERKPRGPVGRPEHGHPVGVHEVEAAARRGDRESRRPLADSDEDPVWPGRRHLDALYLPDRHEPRRDLAGVHADQRRAEPDARDLEDFGLRDQMGARDDHGADGEQPRAEQRPGRAADEADQGQDRDRHGPAAAVRAAGAARGYSTTRGWAVGGRGLSGFTGPGRAAWPAHSFRLPRASTSSGPSAVTSPAPMVRTRAPGRAIRETSGATCDRSGTKCARPPGTASAMSAPVTPGSGSSRAAYTSRTTIWSARSSAAPNSAAKILVLLYRCGWKTAITCAPAAMSRAARRSAASSVG